VGKPKSSSESGRSDTTEVGPDDPELAALVASWPTLPDHIKAAVRALVGIATDPSEL